MHTKETKTSFQEIIKEKFVVFTSLSFYLSRSTILSLYILPLRIFYSADKLRKFVEVMAHKKVFFFIGAFFVFAGEHFLCSSFLCFLIYLFLTEPDLIFFLFLSNPFLYLLFFSSFLCSLFFHRLTLLGPHL